MLDIVSIGDNLQDKSKLFLLGNSDPSIPMGPSWKNMKNVSLCSPIFLCTRHRAKLRRKVPMKNIYIYKKINKIVIISKSLPNLAILSVYILFNSAYI